MPRAMTSREAVGEPLYTVLLVEYHETTNAS